MSFKAAVLKLRSPVKDLVLSVTHDGSEFLGENESDAKDVLGWIDKMSQEDFSVENGLKVCRTISLYHLSFFDDDYFQDLDSLLVPKTYVATNYLTAADVAFYGSLHPVFVSTSYLG